MYIGIKLILHVEVLIDRTHINFHMSHLIRIIYIKYFMELTISKEEFF